MSSCRHKAIREKSTPTEKWNGTIGEKILADLKENVKDLASTEDKDDGDNGLGASEGTYSRFRELQEA